MIPTWSEFNGATPTETTGVTSCYWKNIDDATTAYTSAQVSAGNNSVEKCQALKFNNATGASITVSALSYIIGVGVTMVPIGSALSGSPYFRIVAAIPSSGTGAFVQNSTSSTPAAMTSRGGFTPIVFPTSGTTLGGSFGTSTSPFSVAGGTSTSVAASANLYATALYTQLQTGGSLGAGQLFTGTTNVTATWTES